MIIFPTVLLQVAHSVDAGSVPDTVTTVNSYPQTAPTPKTNVVPWCAKSH